MEQKPSLDLIYDETKDLLIRQLENVDGLDSKASAIAGLDGVIVAISLGLLPNLPTLPSTVSARLASLLSALIVAGLLVVLVSFCLSLFSYRLTKFKEVLDPEEAQKQLLNSEEAYSKHELLKAMIDSYKENTALIKTKVLRLNLSLYALLMAVLLFGAAATIYILA